MTFRVLRHRLLAGLARALVGIFYRRLDVVGLEHVPARGPVLLAANHQNGLVDPLVLLAAVDRPVRAIAKAPLFRHPLIAPFLHWAGAIPVQRRHDPGHEPERNREAFAAVEAALGRGEAVLIFPEGMSQPEPTLMPLRTGAARMVLGAAPAAEPTITVLPVGLVFDRPAVFRLGTALVSIGPPLPLADMLALHRRDPEAAVRQLTARLADSLRRQMVEARDRQSLALLRVLEEAWRGEAGGAGDHAARSAWMQRALAVSAELAERAPADMEAFRQDAERYAKELELAGISGRQAGRRYTAGTVLRYALREGVPLLLAAPLALLGLALHGLPYELTGRVVRLLRPDGDTEATYKIAAGVVLFPAGWVLEVWLAWYVGGPRLALAVALALGPAGLFALAWRDRLGRFSRETSAFLAFLAKPDLHRRLALRRRQVVAEMDRLAHLAERTP